MRNITQRIVSRRAAVVGSLTASAFMALAGCGKKDDQDTEEEKQTEHSPTFNAYLPENLRCIDPYNANDPAGRTIVGCLFDPLMRYDFKTAQIVPCACTAWECNDRGDLFTFHLVPGATFHNGEAVDATAFKRSWERIVNPRTNKIPSALAYHLSCVEGYDALSSGAASELVGLMCPDETTFVVRLSVPFPDFSYVVTHTALAPVPKVALENFDAFQHSPVGNGPFEMDGTWQKGECISVKRFEGYHGTKPKINGVHFCVIKDSATAFDEFAAGCLDVSAFPSSERKNTITKYGLSDDGCTMTSGKHVLLGPACLTHFLVYNMNDPVMSDKNVRCALSLAINRQAICEKIFENMVTSADNIVSPLIRGYQKDVWTYARYDKKEAERLLDIDHPRDSSGKRNLDIVLSCATLGDPDVKKQYEMIVADWSQLGIAVRLDFKDQPAFLADRDAGSFQVGVYSWSADYPLMDNFLYPLFYTGAGNNYSRYSNSHVDKLLLEARSKTDEDKRLALLQEVNAFIADDMPVVPLIFDAKRVVGSERIKYLYVNPVGFFDWISVELNK